MRYTRDEKDFSNYAYPPLSPVLGNRAALGFTTPDGPVKDSKTWDHVTPRVILNYHPSADTLLFGSVTTGYKSGGFSSFGLSPGVEYGKTVAVPGQYKPASYGPENSTSYELGYKGTLFQGDTRVTANAFYYQYKDMQVNYFDGALIQVDNVGKIDGWGFEGSISQSLGEHFELNSAIAWFDSEANELEKICDGSTVCEGQAIPWAPEWSGHMALVGNYPVGDGEVFGMAAYHFQTDQEAGWEPDSFTVDGYGELNLSIGYRYEEYSVSAYVDNATNEDYYDGGGNGDSVFPAYQYGPSRPRTVGMKLTMDFD